MQYVSFHELYFYFRTQIRNDQDGNCFETNTELCALDQARDIKAQWNALNRNITALCKEGT